MNREPIVLVGSSAQIHVTSTSNSRDGTEDGWETGSLGKKRSAHYEGSAALEQQRRGEHVKGEANSTPPSLHRALYFVAHAATTSSHVTT